MKEPQEVQELRTRFKRSKFCRVIHADGAWGSVTPQLNVHMALFSEHRALPDGTLIQMDEVGGVKDTPTEDPAILIREIEADVILSEQAAIALRDWLTGRIDQLKGFRTEVASAQRSEQA